MAELSRAASIERGLDAYRTRNAATRDTLRIPLRNSTVLEVIEVPLNVPLLNAESFRIAPSLADHAEADVVRSSPNSQRAQDIVAELVRKSHRHADDLKQSLLDEGQDQPGVITHDGVLINGNTRCVLLRELVRDGKSSASTIRVAVLPADVSAGERLGLESVLQKQREHKDEYNLVSELMMIEKLYTSAGMSDQQIAASLRTAGGAKRVKELRAVLVLMHRARRLSTTTTSLTAFVAEQDQKQNWLELLRDVGDIEAVHGRQGADAHIRRWLVAYYSGNSSVHRLRAARGNWVEKDVIAELLEAPDEISVALAAAAATPRPEAPAATKPIPKGLDLLDGGPAPASETPAPPEVQNLLDMIVDAGLAGDGSIVIPGGLTVPAPDVRNSIHVGVKSSLEALKRRATSANKLTRPLTLIGQARSALSDLLDALEEVVEDPQFARHRGPALALTDEASDLLDRARALLGDEDNDID
jgi:hypothetical protein